MKNKSNTTSRTMQQRSAQKERAVRVLSRRNGAKYAEQRYGENWAQMERETSCAVIGNGATAPQQCVQRFQHTHLCTHCVRDTPSLRSFRRPTANRYLRRHDLFLGQLRTSCGSTVAVACLAPHSNTSRHSRGHWTQSNAALMRVHTNPPFRRFRTSDAPSTHMPRQSRSAPGPRSASAAAFRWVPLR